MSRTILIVDDQPASLALLKITLKRHKFKVLTCHSGDEALAIINQLGCDLVIIDLMMPDMNGIELCQRIRAQSEYAQIPIIIYSAAQHLDNARRSLEAGANCFLTNTPGIQNQLLTKIRALLD